MTMPITASLRVMFLAALALAPLARPAVAQQAAPSPGTMSPMAPGGAMTPMMKGMMGQGMTGQGMMGMHMSAPPATSGDTGPSSQAFKAANDRMMQGMDVKLTGNADQDFVASMLPHHQGAVDMAKVELQYGKDAELRRLAQNIIAAQDKEIAQMQAWQKKHPAAH